MYLSHLLVYIYCLFLFFVNNFRAEEQFADSLMSQELTAATVFDLLQKLKIKGLAGDFFILVLKVSNLSSF